MDIILKKCSIEYIHSILPNKTISTMEAKETKPKELLIEEKKKNYFMKLTSISQL